MQTDRFRRPDDPALAIFIQRTPDGSHTGILFRMNGVLIIQDLRWHEMFRSELCRHMPHFVMLGLEPEEEHNIRAMCRLIHERQNSRDPSREYRIPYAFRHGNNNRCNRNTGELMLVDGIGLTCSTFVLTIFQSVEVPLVNFDGWQHRADDEARHRALIDRMRTGFPQHGIPPASPEHVARVEGESPCIRVRPEEVAATGMFNDIPVTFEQLAPAGAWILAQIAPAA
jgi:hypothetical protein